MKLATLLIALFLYWQPTDVSAQLLRAFERDATGNSSSRSSSSNSSRDRDKNDDDDGDNTSNYDYDDHDDDDDRRKGRRLHHLHSDHHHYDHDHYHDHPRHALRSGPSVHSPLTGFMLGFENSMTWMTRNGRLDHREPGDVRTPYARFDIDYQDVNGDVEALGWMAEGGYGRLALYARQTRFTEDLPAEAGGGEDRLRVTHGYVTARAVYESGFAATFGAGGLSLDGEDSNSGFSFTVPMQYRPNEHVAVEFRPAWARVNGNAVTELDFALLGGINHANVKVGWRQLESPNVELDGFYTGVSLRW